MELCELHIFDLLAEMPHKALEMDILYRSSVPLQAINVLSLINEHDVIGPSNICKYDLDNFFDLRSNNWMDPSTKPATANVRDGVNESDIISAVIDGSCFGSFMLSDDLD